MYSAAIRCGLIEALSIALNTICPNTYSAAIRCGLIEATLERGFNSPPHGIPQRFAAASLKQHIGIAARQFGQSIPQRFAAASFQQLAGQGEVAAIGRYSAAIRCGLIEAATSRTDGGARPCIPQRFAAASLKQCGGGQVGTFLQVVFRSDSLRPH